MASSGACNRARRSSARSRMEAELRRGTTSTRGPIGRARASRSFVAAGCCWATLATAALLLPRRATHSRVQLTTDHRAMESKERSRILKAGGQIRDERVWGALAVAHPRRLPVEGHGARPHRRAGTHRARDRRRRQYLVLGSDGFFDVLSNKMIGRIACRMNSSAQKVCNALVAEARKKLSTDDTTVVVVQLGSKGGNNPSSP